MAASSNLRGIVFMLLSGFTFVLNDSLMKLAMADLTVMEHDTKVQRGSRPFVFTDLLRLKGVDDIVAFLEKQGGLQAVH